MQSPLIFFEPSGSALAEVIAIDHTGERESGNAWYRPVRLKHVECVRLGTPGNADWEAAHMTQLRMSLTMGLLFWLMLGACEQQGPPPKPIGAATNKHVEETRPLPSRSDADAMIQNMKVPMEDARQTEDVLKGAAGRTRQQSEQTTP